MTISKCQEKTETVLGKNGERFNFRLDCISTVQNHCSAFHV